MDVEQLASMCKTVRRALEPGMPLGDSGIPNPTGTCLYASFLLHVSIQNFTTCVATICGGDGLLDGGVLGTDGFWHGHYWVEVELGNGSRFVADITADQFGYHPIVVLSYPDASATYHAGHQPTIDEAVSDLAAEFPTQIS